MIWSPFVLVAAAAAAKPKKRTATPGLVLASFGDGPKYEATLAYFRGQGARNASLHESSSSDDDDSLPRRSRSRERPAPRPSEVIVID